MSPQRASSAVPSVGKETPRGEAGHVAFEVENFPIYALDLRRVDGPAIEDARLLAGLFLVIAADPESLYQTHTRTLQGYIFFDIHALF